MMENGITLQAAVQALLGIAWGPGTIGLLALCGLVFSAASGFFQIRCVGLWLRSTVGSAFTAKGNGGVSAFQSACTALAATLGTGNIAGVATALAAGGPGAVFWMWISALLGTMTAFAENVLAALYRSRNGRGEPVGGAMYYIEKGLHSRRLAAVFSFFCLLGSLGMGNMAQSNSIAEGLRDVFGAPAFVTGLVTAAVIAVIIAGGFQRVGRVAEKIVPFMALAYTVGAAAIVAVNLERLPWVAKTILNEAFSLRAGLGGAAGYGLAKALTVGVARGVSSNEAGLGSSVMANSAADGTPMQQGMWGVFEVAVDTLFMCTLTALAILCSGVYDPQIYAAAQQSGGLSDLPNGAVLTAQAFRSVYGEGGGVFVALSLTLFAFSTLLGWSCYGAQAAEYLWGAGAVKLYKGVFVAAVVVGCVSRLELVWQISDAFNGFMALPNLAALLWLSPQVLRECRAGIPIAQKYCNKEKKALHGRENNGIL